MLTEAIQLTEIDYKCLTFQESLNISLGVKSPGSSLIARVTDVHQLEKRGPILFESIHPLNGPKQGGTVITIKGQNFMYPVKFNSVILCKFGTFKVTAEMVNGDTIQCKTPPSSKTGPVELSLDIENSEQFYFVSRTMKYFYDDTIIIQSVIPNLMDLSHPIVTLAVKTTEPIIQR